MEIIPGIGKVDIGFYDNFHDLNKGGNGLWEVGCEGVRRILLSLDDKIELIIYNDKTLVYIKSQLNTPAIYPLTQ